MLDKWLSRRTIKQFISYFCVGGTAALVEWGTFSLMEFVFGVPYLYATVISFVLATAVNWILGRMFTFRSSAYQDKKLKEMVLIYVVSLIGLVLNLVLMYLFVRVLGMETNLLKTCAKIIATGIVFIWNFLARKTLVYRE